MSNLDRSPKTRKKHRSYFKRRRWLRWVAQLIVAGAMLTCTSHAAHGLMLSAATVPIKLGHSAEVIKAIGEIAVLISAEFIVVWHDLHGLKTWAKRSRAVFRRYWRRRQSRTKLEQL